jgi:hypothetical protein
MIPSLQAEEQLTAFEAAASPYWAERDRKDATRRYLRLVGQDAKPRKATPAVLASMGIKHSRKEVKR